MPNDDLLLTKRPFGPLGLISLDGFMDRAKKVDEYLVDWRSSRTLDHADDYSVLGYRSGTYILDTVCPRFGTGEGKGIIQQTVRGLDVYIFADIMNYSLTYKMFGQENHMSPDDHYADLKRIIAACGSKPKRITVFLPFLYESRQHRKKSRESLDCAISLHELVNMGVSNIVTFDAHDPRVQNSIPLSGFETIRPTYQFLKGICSHVNDIVFDNDHLMIISPDEGATDRAVYMASILGVNVGMFYKRRDYSRIVKGRNPIVAHEFLGGSVEGKDVFVMDDMISSGESMIEVARELKSRKAKRVFCFTSFGLFTGGMNSFDKAVEQGVIEKVISTDLIYQSPELLSRDYYISCPMSKYIAYIVDTLNHDTSIGTLVDPYDRIHRLVKQYKS